MARFNSIGLRSISVGPDPTHFGYERLFLGPGKQAHVVTPLAAEASCWGTECIRHLPSDHGLAASHSAEDALRGEPWGIRRVSLQTDDRLHSRESSVGYQ